MSDDIFELNIDEKLRPRVCRRLGIPLRWDQAVDSLPRPNIFSFGGLFAIACIGYRHIRPKKIGDRCGFEPSCSRYAELSFRAHGLIRGARLTILRLRRCKSSTGGLDLPPLLDKVTPEELGEELCSTKLKQ